METKSKVLFPLSNAVALLAECFVKESKSNSCWIAADADKVAHLLYRGGGCQKCVVVSVFLSKFDRKLKVLSLPKKAPCPAPRKALQQKLGLQ